MATTIEQNDGVTRLERDFKVLVIDMLLTRWHGRELNQMLDQYREGDLDPAFILGFVSTLREGKVRPRHLGAGRTLYDYVTREMHDLVIAKFGQEKGIEMYRNLFGFLFLTDDLLVDESLNTNLLTSWLSNLEASLAFVEQTVFITAFESTKKYLNHVIISTGDLLYRCREALANNHGDLPNGRKVDNEYIDELEWKLTAYDEALSRLNFFKEKCEEFEVVKS